MDLHKHEPGVAASKGSRRKRVSSVHERDIQLLSAFLEARCAPSALGGTPARTLYLAFCAWCQEGEHPTSMTPFVFNKLLRAVPGVALASGTGVGLRLKTRAERGLPPLLIGLYGKPMPPQEAAAWEEVVRLWSERWGTATVSSEELMDQLSEAIPLPAGSPGRRLSHMGCVLRALEGQRVGAWVIEVIVQRALTHTRWSYALRAAAPYQRAATTAA